MRKQTVLSPVIIIPHRYKNTWFLHLATDYHANHKMLGLDPSLFFKFSALWSNSDKMSTLMYKNKDKKKNEDTVQPYSCVTVRNVSPSGFGIVETGGGAG